MSRTSDRIVRQAESQGFAVTSIRWEPVGLGAEKEGPSGGWDVYLNREGKEDWAGGYNAEQVMEWIRNFDRPPAERTDPFSCSGKYSGRDPDDCILARGHRGDHVTHPRYRS